MTPYHHHLRRTKYGMSVNAEILLDMVKYSAQPITVMGLMEWAGDIGVASPATLHRAIQWLKANGYLHSGTRHLSVTHKAKDYFQRKPR